MTKDVQSCRPETNLADAAMPMWRNDWGVLPVVADGGKVVRMITDRGICMGAATNIVIRQLSALVRQPLARFTVARPIKKLVIDLKPTNLTAGDERTIRRAEQIARVGTD